MSHREGEAYARERDAADTLAGFRERFHIPPREDGSETVYLAGNSLGLQPRHAAVMVEEELRDWQRLGVEGHFHGRRPWMPYHELATENTATLVGALPIEVVCMNTLTVNLHLMMVSFFRPTRRRFRIVIERPAFPSDRYAVVSQLRFHGLDPDDALLEVEPRDGEAIVRHEDIAALIEEQGESIALILLPGVQYYSGQLFDMAAITRLGHEHGCVVGFDLAHAAGNVPLALHDWDVDFAVWCTYKYLNAGPGAVAGCFVHERYAQDDALPRFAGWWGHDRHSRFRMGPDFVPMAGAEGWQLSNPPILSLAPVVAALELFDNAGMEALREKSLDLTAYLAWLMREHLAEEVDVITPLDPAQRGCQLSLRVRGEAEVGREAQQRLMHAGVICDWREPDVIRVAPVPLYNTYLDVYRFAEVLEEALRP